MSPQTSELSPQDVGMQSECHPKLADNDANRWVKPPPGDSLSIRALVPFQPDEVCSNLKLQRQNTHLDKMCKNDVN